jgi:PPOX class probable F420-dependent enzyme
VPKPPLPPELDAFLREPNPCVIATIRPDGELHTAATWCEWPGDGTVLVNMDATRLRLGHMRADPRVALTVLDKDAWYNHVSLIGRVRELRHDEDLADIDRIATHYTGKPYRDRERDSWTAVIEVTRWHGWRGGVDLTKE